MSIHPVFASVAFHAGLGMAGALAGDVVMKVHRRGRREASSLSILPGTIVGAMAAPTAYHLAEPLVAHSMKHGAAAALRAAPPLVFTGLARGGLFGGAAIAGTVIGGTITDDGLYDGSLTALPAAATGAVAGPMVCAGLRGALGATPGSLAFVALAAGVVRWQASRAR